MKQSAALAFEFRSGKNSDKGGKTGRNDPWATVGAKDDSAAAGGDDGSPKDDSVRCERWMLQMVIDSVFLSYNFWLSDERMVRTLLGFETECLSYLAKLLTYPDSLTA